MNKNETIALKGIAILKMFWHHLFGCENFLVLPENEFLNCFGKYDAVFGHGCKLCISVFAFVSGYGFYLSYIQEHKREIGPIIYKFLLSYWTVMFGISIPYLIYFHHFNISYLFVNLFALLHNDEMLYVSFSWYAKVYMLLLLLLPLLRKIQACGNDLFSDILLIALPLVLRDHLPDSEANFQNIGIFVLSSIRLLFTWFPIFYVGMLYAKYNIFERMNNESLKRGLYILEITASFFLILLAIYEFGRVEDIILVQLFVVGYHNIYSKMNARFFTKLLVFLGNYSFQYWLISGMFFLNTTELQWILFLPRYTIVILIWSFVVILPFAIITKWLSNLVYQKTLMALNPLGKTT